MFLNGSVAFNDKEYITAGPRPTGVTPVCFTPAHVATPCGDPKTIGVDRVYVTWSEFDANDSQIQISWSDDQGRSWSPNQTISGSAPFCIGSPGNGATSTRDPSRRSTRRPATSGSASSTATRRTRTSTSSSVRTTAVPLHRPVLRHAALRHQLPAGEHHAARLHQPWRAVAEHAHQQLLPRQLVRERRGRSSRRRLRRRPVRHRRRQPQRQPGQHERRRLPLPLDERRRHLDRADPCQRRPVRGRTGSRLRPDTRLPGDGQSKDSLRRCRQLRERPVLPVGRHQLQGRSQHRHAGSPARHRLDGRRVARRAASGPATT